MNIKPRKIFAAGLICFCLGAASWLTVVGGLAYSESGCSDGGCQTAAKSRPVIVIDPGHGGFDGGAQAADGTEEKQINLSIARKLEEAAAGYPVEVILTRTGDEGLYSASNQGNKKREDLLRRKEIMAEANPVVAVSIHLNSFPQDASVYGAQVFYSPDGLNGDALRTGEQEGEQRKPDSRDFAESVQKALESHISDGRERSAMAKNDVLILKNPPCPVILAECGFLSNPAEAEKLKTAEYQGLLAEAIWDGINAILCLEKEEKVQVVDSANRSLFS